MILIWDELTFDFWLFFFQMFLSFLTKNKIWNFFFTIWKKRDRPLFFSNCGNKNQTKRNFIFCTWFGLMQWKNLKGYLIKRCFVAYIFKKQRVQKIIDFRRWKVERLVSIDCILHNELKYFLKKHSYFY